MNVYTTDKIRNVVLLGHGSCGKTTLAEAMCYLAGVTSRLGSIDDGNTVSDYDKEEQKRKISISTSTIPIEWDGCKINILDTPGFFDFVGEVEEAISVADAAIIVVSGKSGIEVGTQKAWDLCEEYNIPRMIYVSDMDIDEVSYRQVVQDLVDKFGKKIAPFNLPVREDEKLIGYVNVIQEKAFRWENKEATPMDVPDYSKEYLASYRDTLMEAVAETSEDLMERYFNGETFSENEIRSALRTNVCDGSIVPVEQGSSIYCEGVYTLLDDIVKYMPSPENRKMSGINTKTNEIFEANFDFSKPKTAFVFKTIIDPFIGKYSLIKVRSGVLKTDDVLYDPNKDEDSGTGKAASVMKVINDLKGEYNNYLQGYVNILNFFLETIHKITDLIRQYSGNGNAFSFLNGKFIGTNLKIILKYLDHSLGKDFYTVGICLCIVGLSLILSISSTILLIVIINIELEEYQKQEKNQNNANTGLAVSEYTANHPVQKAY